MCYCLLKGPFDAALLSLSVAYVMQLAGSFQYGVRLSAEVENLVRNHISHGYFWFLDHIYMIRLEIRL